MTAGVITVSHGSRTCALRLYNWTVRQSGGALAIDGMTDHGGEVHTVRNVHRIEAVRGLFRSTTYALDRDGRPLARLL